MDGAYTHAMQVQYVSLTPMVLQHLSPYRNLAPRFVVPTIFHKILGRPLVSSPLFPKLRPAHFDCSTPLCRT